MFFCDEIVDSQTSAILGLALITICDYIFCCCLISNHEITIDSVERTLHLT